MGNFSLLTPTIYVHELDLTGYLNKYTIHMAVDELDVTPFGSLWHQRIGGLKTVETHGEGFWDSVPDASIFGDLGAVDRALTVCAEGAETKTAYMLQAARFDYEALGQIGQAAPFIVSSKNTNKVGVVRGQLGKAKGVVSATGALGSGLNLGAAGAAQFLYTTLHLFAVGTSITVLVQSDTSGAFSAPTTRATIGPLTTTGGTWMTRVAGPITDTWWRFNVSAITGSFTVAGAIGIQ